MYKDEFKFNESTEKEPNKLPIQLETNKNVKIMRLCVIIELAGIEEDLPPKTSPNIKGKCRRRLSL